MINLTEDWATSVDKNVHAIGSAFYEGEMISQDDLVGLFSGLTYEEIRLKAQKLNGFWSVVLQTGQNTVIISDHVGSRAIFYNEELPYVTDNFSDIHAEFPDVKIPREIELEFRMASYVSGSETTNPNVKKTEPGTIVSIGSDGGISIDRYYMYRNNPDPQPITNNLYSKWKQNLEDGFERAVEILDGRQILLGLSGGYDSRLIAMMLDRVGYDNIVAFTIDTGYDQQIAKEIANISGFDWFPLDKEQIDRYDAYESDQWLKVINKLGQSGMYYRWPRTIAADYALQDHELVDQNAVRMWGHTLYHSGGKVTRGVLSDTNSDINDITDSVYTYHYNKQRYSNEDVRLVKSRIRKQIMNKRWASEDQPFNTAERWYWHERLPNFLFRDSFLRSFDVWYPLLDKSVIEFQNYIPAESRYEKGLYEKWVRRLWTETYDVEFTDEKTVRRQAQIQRSNSLKKLYLLAKYSKLREVISKSKLKRYAKLLDSVISDSRGNVEKPTDLDPRLQFVDEKYFEDEYTGQEHYRWFLVSELLAHMRDGN